MTKLKVGDQVLWRGGFGSEPAQKAKVEEIEVCLPGEKYGDQVDEVEWSKKANIVVILDNGHWARGHQISQL